MRRVWYGGALLLLMAAGCAVQPAKPDPTPDPIAAFVTVASQPANVGDAKIAALAYHDDGRYDRDLVTVAGKAAEWVRNRAGMVAKPALVLDIDETSLSNWEVLKRDDFGRPVPGPCAPGLDTPCGWAAWDLLGRDPAIAPTLRLFNISRSLNVTVFFIPGAQKPSEQLPTAICSTSAMAGMLRPTSCQMGRTSQQRPTSRRRSGRKSSKGVSPSLPMLATSLLI